MFAPSRTDLERMMPNAKDDWLGELARVSQVLCPHYKMDRLEWCHFIGQIAHETSGLSLGGMRENMNYSASRMKQVFSYRLTLALKTNLDGVRDEFGTLDRLCKGLAGNPDRLAGIVYGGREGSPVMCGRYIGRGPTQITHLNNYREISKEIARQPGGSAVDLVEKPELLELPEWGVRSAFADWKLKNLRKWAWVDDVDRVSAKLNTGSAEKVSITNGLANRRRQVAKAKGIWPATADRDLVEERFMKEGDEGPEVEAIQRKLIELGYPVGKVDGHFGTLTKRAVVAFQVEHGLVVDGEVGPRTKDVMETSAPAPLGPREETTAKELAKESVTVQVGQSQTFWGRILAFFGFGGTVATLSDAVGLASTAKTNTDAIADLLTWAMSPKGILVVALGVTALIGWRISVHADRIIAAAVEAYRKGRLLGEA